MAVLDFPNDPTEGQVFDRWVWDGTKWVLAAEVPVVPMNLAVPFTPGQAISSSAFQRLTIQPGSAMMQPASGYWSVSTVTAGPINGVAAGTFLVDWHCSFGIAAMNAGTYVHAYLNRYTSGALLESITGAASPYGEISGSMIMGLGPQDTVDVTMSTTNGPGCTIRGGILNMTRLSTEY